MLLERTSGAYPLLPRMTSPSHKLSHQVHFTCSLIVFTTWNTPCLNSFEQVPPAAPQLLASRAVDACDHLHKVR